MPETYLSNLIERIRYHLMDTTTQWSNEQLSEYIQKAVSDISEYSPRELTQVCYFRGGTCNLDLGEFPADYPPMRITRVEYEMDMNPPQWRSFSLVGDSIYVNLPAPPYGEVIKTGTCTQTSTGKLIDSSGGFTSTMKYCRVVNTTNSLGLDIPETYITSVDSSTTLSLAKHIFVSGDKYSIYERHGARVYYHTKHILTQTDRTFPVEWEDIIIDGAVAYAMMAYATFGIDRVNIGANVAELFLRLAQTKLALYRSKLASLRKIKVYKDY